MCYIIPPYILSAAGSSGDGLAEEAARTQLHFAELANRKMVYSGLKTLIKKPANTGSNRNRLVYSMDGYTDDRRMPGRLVLDELSGACSDDADLNACFTNAGTVYDFLKDVLGWDSLDGKGMDLISSGHFGQRYNNAFWNGRQMAYGDGDGYTFRSLHSSLDVAAHEMGHGIIDNTCRLIYKGQSGALNESLADVYGVTIEQWKVKVSSARATWLLGEGVIGPASTAKALRSFTKDPAYQGDRIFGTDPQPKHMSGYIHTSEDNGGVHLNSGIPNHAYYLFCMKLGGASYDRPIRVWHAAMKRLWFWHGFGSMAKQTIRAAQEMYGADVAQAAREAWAEVGIRA